MFVTGVQRGKAELLQRLGRIVEFAPAADRAPRRQSAAEVVAGGDLLERPSSRRRGLTALIVAPADEPAIAGERAAVIIAHDQHGVLARGRS